MSSESSDSDSDNPNVVNIINPLCVTVIAARNLPPPKDGSLVWTDKYVVVRIGDSKQQTVMRSSHPNTAQWGDTLQFDISGIPKGEEIFLAVYIQYKITWEMLGEIRLPLDQYRDVSRAFALEHWYPFGTGGGWKRDDLPTKKKNPNPNPGELGLIVGVFEGEGKRLKRRHVFSTEDPYFQGKGADELFVEANEIAKENKQAVDRIVRVAENTREIGAATLAKLHHQADQIDQAQQDVDIINEQISFGEEKLKTIESCCAGCCSCFESKKKKGAAERLRDEALRAQRLEQVRMKAKARASREQKEKDKAKEKNKRFAPARPIPVAKQTSSPVIVLSTEGEFKKTVREIDNNLDHVKNLVSDLNNIAEEMGDELDRQNANIDQLNINSTVEAARLARVTDRTMRLV